ncbi:MAG TPA: hypothetical protein VN651_01705 [Gemmatimonadaceae bacterium]|nr:hypothetical protein [Gemmatimonadaceae bacterium]
MGIWRVSTVERIAERDLPGGAIAAIDIVTTRAAWRRRRYQGVLIVEGSARDRAPIVATARGTSIGAVMGKLAPLLRNDSVLDWAVRRDSEISGRRRELVLEN